MIPRYSNVPYGFIRLQAIARGRRIRKLLHLSKQYVVEDFQRIESAIKTQFSSYCCCPSLTLDFSLDVLCDMVGDKFLFEECRFLTAVQNSATPVELIKEAYWLEDAITRRIQVRSSSDSFSLSNHVFSYFSSFAITTELLHAD